MGKKKRKSQPHNKRLDSLSLPRNQKSKREEIARMIYNHAVQSLRNTSSESNAYKGSLDYDSRHIKRRTQAAISHVDEIRDHVLSVCPEYPEFFTIEEDWIEANLHPLVSYDYIEGRADTALGAAIWILDQIRDHGDIPEELDVLLEAVKNDTDFYMPPVWDPCHSEQMLAGMLYVIQHRNDDCVGLDDKRFQKSEWDTIDQRVYMDPYTTDGKNRQEVPSRTLFESILKLVPEEVIQEAVSAYKEKWWDWVTRYYRSRAVLVKQEADIVEKLNCLADKASRKVEELTAARPAPVLNNILMNKLPAIGEVTNTPGMLEMNQQSVIYQVKQWEEEMEHLEQQRTELYHQITALWVSAGMIPTRCYDAIAEEFGQEIADNWITFEIEDPYQFCFAQLYLIDSGSDLPWMYFPGSSMMMTCASTLPWGLLKYRMEPDGIWVHYDEVSDAYIPGYQKMEMPKRIKLPNLENWYKMEYLDSQEKNSHWQQMYNLSQIIYEITGSIMPRKLDRIYPAIPELDRYGIKGKLALHPLIYCISLLSEARHQNRGSHYHPDFQWIEDVSEEEETVSEEETSDDLKKRIAELEAEVKKLKAVSYDASREVLAEKQRYAKLEEDRDNDRQELADLRELVFHQNQEIYHADSVDEDIEFPYHTERRIVVFGGHDSWAKEIKPKLPDVRFIDRTMQPNADLIRNADVLWLQHNAISHKYYYKIINEARRYHIPVRYFAYSSAVKCAEQIVISEDS